MTEPIWYILYDGDSVDGIGPSTYYGRTTDKEVAKEHLKKCESSFYSIGKVVAFTDTKKHTLYSDYDWEKLK